MKKKECSVAIVGQPNVGKSTLLNAVLKQKKAIVTYKPQTTRNLIQGIFQDDKIKIIFHDTPGYHEPKNKLDQFLNSQVKTSFKQADIVLFLIDSTRDITDEDIKIVKLIEGYDVTKVIVMFTKKDISHEIDVNEKINKLGFNLKVKPMYVSLLSTEDVNNLVLMIYDISPTMSAYSTVVSENDDFIISEIIREHALLNLRQEVPHSLAVYVESKNYDKIENVFTINATIIVEKESQKPIVIGLKGAMIKQIGSLARQDLLKIFDCRVHLQLFVKVEKDWRDNERLLEKLGLFKK